jgi:hypothetical protein
MAGGGHGPATAAARSRIFAALARADEIVSGMLLGCAVTAAVASLVLARSHDLSGLILVAVAAAAMLLRARIFMTVRQRLPLIGAGLAGFLLLALFGPLDGRLVAVCVATAALVVALAGVRAAIRPTSPYSGRAADLLDTLCVAAVVPLACAVLGLYGLFR